MRAEHRRSAFVVLCNLYIAIAFLSMEHIINVIIFPFWLVPFAKIRKIRKKSQALPSNPVAFVYVVVLCITMHMCIAIAFLLIKRVAVFILYPINWSQK